MNELTTFFQDNLVGVFENDAVTTSLLIFEQTCQLWGKNE